MSSATVAWIFLGTRSFGMCFSDVLPHSCRPLLATCVFVVFYSSNLMIWRSVLWLSILLNWMTCLPARVTMTPPMIARRSDVYWQTYWVDCWRAGGCAGRMTTIHQEDALNSRGFRVILNRIVYGVPSALLVL